MKYNTVNPLTKLHPDEPFFFIRGQDKLGPEAVRAYARQLLSAGDTSGYHEVMHIAGAMLEWQAVNADKVKMPD